ncbi:hypothetical protein Ark11_1466 [Candidatus Ichthyocystis hellenicum]|uniref:Uncharacterized protein n=1 Tax=Candidatus Ichthyocystis hellenicum TaxID=1561003 RepID=A0A0S4M7Z2_9BURK|nr:hypothetical protein [Candidatus Ichthyocystis hellenicum]CUT18264.1 hypothetical protein Ark11_1466 [Candidatus Ichthyocystis hellenicum]
MYPYNFDSNFTASNVDETNNTTGDINNSTADQIPQINILPNNDQDLDYYLSILANDNYYLSILAKDRSSCDFLNISTNDSLPQNSDYEEKLPLFNYHEQPSTSYDVSCEFNEYAPHLAQPIQEENSFHDIGDKEFCDTYDTSHLAFAEQITTAPITKNIEQFSQFYTTDNKNTNCEQPKQSVVKKELKLRLYRRNNLSYKEFNASIYKDAIKKIDIDDNKLFRNSVLEEIGNSLKNRAVITSSIDLSVTYSNVRKYIVEKFSPYLNEIIPFTDILITENMSFSDLRSACISNDIFFVKLRDGCEKIVNDIRVTSDDYLSHIFQSYINFSSMDYSNSNYSNVKLLPKKHKFLPKLKELIIDTISNLPNSIIGKIEKFDENEVKNGLFLDLHGVFLSKSLIRSLSSSFNSNKIKFINGKNNDDLNLLNSLFEEIVNLIKTSCIFHERIILPNESIVEKLSKYLLSDMYGVPAKFHKKLKLSTKDKELSDNINLINDYPTGRPNDVSEKKELQPTKLYLENMTATVISTPVDKVIGSPHELEQISTASVTKNINQPEKYITPQELKIGLYRRNKFLQRELSSCIYEDAVKKINIDSDELFKKTVIEKLEGYIVKKGFVKSSLDISSTYSNIRKYISDKVSPYIREIIANSDILINFGMSISDIKHNCISNIVFFEKLRENCEKIIKDIVFIRDDHFSNILQTHINFGFDGRLNISRRRNKFYSELKLLIIETISNLPNDIAQVINNFNQSEIINGLFLEVHGVSISKSLVRNLSLFGRSHKLLSDNLNENLYLLSILLGKLVDIVKKSFIFHKGELFFPDTHSANILSRYLISDMYNIPSTLHKNLKLLNENIPESEKLTKKEECHKYIKIINLGSSYKNNLDFSTNLSSQLLEETTLNSKKNSKWNPNSITSLNIYELAISMINIDKEDFEKHFMDEIKDVPLVEEYISKKEKVYIDLSATYDRVKSYILDALYPFLKKNEEETKNKIKIYHGITLDELEQAYTSNNEFFTKLQKFCSKIVNNVKNCVDSTLVDLIQCFIHPETEGGKAQKIIMKKNSKIKFHRYMAKMIIKNVSNVPEIIIGAIKLLPRSKLVKEHLSPFHHIYVDNSSLLKAKLLFDSTHKKITDDPLLRWLIDKTSTDMICKFKEEKSITPSKRSNKSINSNVARKKISTYRHIGKLVKEEMIVFRNTIGDNIIIMHHNIIEIANQDIKCKILDKFESDLITSSVKLYKKLCTKAYKLKLKITH